MTTEYFDSITDVLTRLSADMQETEATATVAACWRSAVRSVYCQQEGRGSGPFSAEPRGPRTLHATVYRRPRARAPRSGNQIAISFREVSMRKRPVAQVPGAGTGNAIDRSRGPRQGTYSVAT